ncbi:AAA family ATPase [Pseudomonas fluorescens]|uniref:DNA replication and repair protein RecF n=1 Tax=Pseudomonas fluorescens TaxID=294 RepID=A0A5E7Q3D6_PSEFL|nr:AAA family ATPase [Pseudomonas fluorescens]VVP56626.1 DNA replication and repair protein RecF [Pseudomonas fluorescens]
MRLNHLFVENFQGLQACDLDLTAPITLVSGPNGAGKTSLQEAINLALGGKARVAQKQDYKQLITEGQKKAQIIVSHDDVASSYSLTASAGKGDHTLAVGDEYLPYVLTPSLFASLKDVERRKMLFALTKSSSKPQVVVDKLLAKGADAAKVEKIKPLLLSGFTAAQEQAKTYTSECRGAWKALTGEVYGSEKAEDWTVTIQPMPDDAPEVTLDDLANAQKSLTAAATEIEKGTQHLGGLRAKRENSDTMAVRKVDLEKIYLELNRRKKKLDATNKELEPWKAKVSEAEQKITAFSGESPCECPSCGVKLKIVGQVIELFKGKTADAAKLTKAQADLKTANDAYNLMARTQVNDQKAVAESEQAGRDLDALVKSAGEEVTDAQIKRVEDAIQVQRKARDTAKAKVDAISERLDLIATAEQKAADAAAHHADVKAWTHIAELLAPDGIPSEILAGALKPFNDSLARSSTISTWKKVQIGADMNITAGGRLYTLLSESERWRTDCLLDLAIAEHSGLKFVILDRFDVLDIPGRGQLFGMLVKMVKVGTIDSAIVCGTLKTKPENLPAEINAVWIEDGKAVGTEKLQEAS